MRHIEQLIALTIGLLVMLVPLAFAIDYRQQAKVAVAQADDYHARLQAAVRQSTGMDLNILDTSTEDAASGDRSCRVDAAPER